MIFFSCLYLKKFKIPKGDTIIAYKDLKEFFFSKKMIKMILSFNYTCTDTGYLAADSRQ